MPERYTTLGESTLGSAVDASTASWPVSSAASFPPAGNFRVRCGNEIVKVTGVSGSTLNVVRGQEGTAAAPHSSGASVTEVLTAEALDAIRADMCQTAAQASRPAVHKAGGLFLPSNGFSLQRDTGSAWEHWGPLVRCTPQAYSGLAWVNQSTATGSDDPVLHMSVPANAGNNLNILKKAAGGSTFTFTVMCLPTSLRVNWSRAGICMRESATGKIMTFVVGHDAQFIVDRWADPTTYVTSPLSHGSNPWMASCGTWLRLAYDGTNCKASVSADGLNWVEVLSEAKTLAFTSAPDEIGICVSANNATYGAALTVPHWSES